MDVEHPWVHDDITLTIIPTYFCPSPQGLTLSRAAVHFFKHNDPEDLERVIQAVEEKERAEK